MMCRDLDTRIGDFIAGELSAVAGAAFEAHVDGCTACRDYVASYRSTVLSVKAAFADDEPPRELVREVVDAAISNRVRGRHIEH